MASEIAKKKGRLAQTFEDETLDNISKIIEIEKDQRAHRTLGEKISEWIALFAGSMFFVYLHLAWFGIWIGINLSMAKPFDPFPFTFLTLVVSLEAIFLSTFILISQNHENELMDRRNQLDLQVNMLAERENTKMLELLKTIAEKLGVDCDDAAMTALLKPVEPEKLVKEILKASNEDLAAAEEHPEKIKDAAATDY
jgi:uncharacterized membrane protein